MEQQREAALKRREAELARFRKMIEEEDKRMQALRERFEAEAAGRRAPEPKAAPAPAKEQKTAPAAQGG